ncbi:uncharacterized protein LOC114179536 [Vigna unguiculata]|uniref:uncharacterized protein LOC114179536 n=1 Tax=Vigna unguiculata TaxID=3917 RepID=UPI0010169E2B|nr:uncharacterized protein LOC114179536 [Vigna unguiculata]
MLRFTSNSNHSFFFLFFCIFFFLFSASAPTPSDGVEDVDQERYEEVVVVPPWTARRSMAEGASFRNVTLVLAKERTRRQDWFNGFNLYNGGWNISNAHYLTSVMSTAGPFIVVAVAWFVIFGVVLLISCALCCCCNGGESSDYSKLVHYFSLFLLILSTIITIGGCAQLYTGQGKIDGSTSETLDYVLNRAQLVAENLNTISTYFDSAKHIVSEPPLPLDIDLGPNLDDIKFKIDRAADTLSNKVTANSKIIRKVIDGVRLALIIVAVVLFFVTFLRLFFCLLGLQCPVYSLVVIGWILVTCTLVLCAAFIFVHNMAGDTCVAMDEWVVNPTAHTALDDIFPCVEEKAVMETYLKSKMVTYKIIEEFDKVISNFTNANQSVPLLCNPFNSDLTSRNCSSEEVTFQNATQVWKNFKCEVSLTEKCRSVGRLTPILYTKLGAAVNVTYGLFQYGPFFADLLDCNFVRKTFNDISRTYCPPLRRYCEQVYLGSVLVSAAVMLSLVSSLFFVREQFMFLHNNRVF